MTSSNNSAATGPACPICAKPMVGDYAPFCSKRCADIDLHRWLTGGYAIPAVEAEDDSEIETQE
ncbi:MAG: DNA gyrase inhibitor YacG [Pseudomonadota bacterium]|nr:DNA gyrase inhibitor YacG [Pseudomonadota bacterium]